VVVALVVEDTEVVVVEVVVLGVEEVLAAAPEALEDTIGFLMGP